MFGPIRQQNNKTKELIRYIRVKMLREFIFPKQISMLQFLRTIIFW